MSSERWLRVISCLIAALVLSSCATGYGAGRDHYGQRDPNSSYVDLVGTVVGLERGYNRIVLEVQNDRYYDRSEQVEIRYDPRAQLHYQGRAYPVDGLERGDVIRVEGRRSGTQLVAQSIKLLRDVREQGGNDYGQDRSLRGTVRYVQLRDRVISLDVDYGERVWVRFDNRTIVEYDGRRYQPADLESGDVVRIEAQRYGNDWVAEVIHVQRDSRRY